MNKKIEVGCGYCKNEKTCKKREPKVNKVKKGCLDYKHHKDNH